MAHFAKINSENIVDSVIVIDNKDCAGGDFPESEPVGQAFIRDVVGLDGEWLQVSYNHSFRRRYPNPGFIYDRDYDVFYPPQFRPDWVLDKETWQWVSPDGRERVPVY